MKIRKSGNLAILTAITTGISNFTPSSSTFTISLMSSLKVHNAMWPGLVGKEEGTDHPPHLSRAYARTHNQCRSQRPKI
ncbi:hypothetical protein N8641_01555 [Akkermansiaceae bacterium]|nr:hypothetical protein [Akkermansiaceae bacterium]